LLIKTRQGRIEDKDYAVVTVDHAESIGEVIRLLRAEYELLLMSEYFCKKFRNLTSEYNVIQ